MVPNRPEPADRAPVLVTGASGYIGSRLVPRLLDAGYTVRCLVRDRRKLAARTWYEDPRVSVVEGDVNAEERLAQALRGCGSAYYLIHSMIAKGEDYRDHDRRLATQFAKTAASEGVGRIVYLGGLGEMGPDLSEHLRSRREVERALSSTGVPVTVLRAAMIIGSGSASFEILRYLVERLPVMITPRWVQTESQPIAVDDALYYLVRCLAVPETTGQTLDIGGPEVMTYRQIMQSMAETLGLRKRLIMPVPVLTPRLSSLWIHLITPVSHRIARPLAEGLKNRVVLRDDRARQLMPHETMTVEEALRAAVGRIPGEVPESRWTDAGVIPGDPDWAGGTEYRDRQTTLVDASPDAVYRAVTGLGGRQGWFQSTWLWRVRGWLDRLVGGPGLGRGRRRPKEVQYGDVLDFWRVAGVDPGKMIELRAEMKLPGEAILRFETLPRNGGSELVQTAIFRPRGMAGILYWWLVTPFHGPVFKSMLRGIKERAESETGDPHTAPDGLGVLE